MLLLPDTLTAVDARDTLRMLAVALQAEPENSVVIDASGLLHFDSSALAVLLECKRQSQAWGKTFAVGQPPPKLAALAKLYGVDTLLMGQSATPAPT
jgi:phospholipid transport system transporter-binding protein